MRWRLVDGFDLGVSLRSATSFGCWRRPARRLTARCRRRGRRRDRPGLRALGFLRARRRGPLGPLGPPGLTRQGAARSATSPGAPRCSRWCSTSGWPDRSRIPGPGRGCWWPGNVAVMGGGVVSCTSCRGTPSPMRRSSTPGCLRWFFDRSPREAVHGQRVRMVRCCAVVSCWRCAAGPVGPVVHVWAGRAAKRWELVPSTGGRGAGDAPSCRSRIRPSDRPLVRPRRRRRPRRCRGSSGRRWG